MAIAQKDLQALLSKIASQVNAKDLPPAQQAMAGAAQAANQIPGQIKAPNVFPMSGGGDPAGDALAQEQEQKAVQDEMDKRDQEIESLKKEKNSIEQQLHEEQITRMQSDAQARLEQERMKFQQEMQKGHEELERDRSKAQAEEIQHEALLRQQVADQKAELANEKAKMMTDFANQQAQRYVKTTEDAAKDIAKQRDESYKQIDDYRNKSMEAIEAARPGVSPALQSQMQGAIQAMKSVGKIKDRMHAIPKPGTPPRQVQDVPAIADSGAGILDKAASQMDERVAARTGVTPQPGNVPLKLVQHSQNIARLEGRQKGLYPVGEEGLRQSREDREQLALARESYAKEKKILEARAAAGDETAVAQLAHDKDFRREYTDRSGPWAWWRSLNPWAEDKVSSGYQDAVNQATTDMRAPQPKWVQEMWKPSLLEQGVDLVGNHLFGFVPRMADSVDTWEKTKEMAADRGITKNWFTPNTGSSYLHKDLRDQARAYGIKATSPWAHGLDTSAAAAAGLGRLGAYAMSMRMPVASIIADTAISALEGLAPDGGITGQYRPQAQSLARHYGAPANYRYQTPQQQPQQAPPFQPGPQVRQVTQPTASVQAAHTHAALPWQTKQGSTGQSGPAHANANIAQVFNNSWGGYDIANPGKYGILSGGLGTGLKFADQALRALAGFGILPQARQTYSTSKRLPSTFAASVMGFGNDPRMKKPMGTANPVGQSFMDAYSASQLGQFGAQAYNQPRHNAGY